MEKEQQEITARLNQFEKEMSFNYIPGVVAFMEDLRAHGVKIAIVTSSNDLTVFSQPKCLLVRNRLRIVFCWERKSLIQ